MVPAAVLEAIRYFPLELDATPSQFPAGTPFDCTHVLLSDAKAVERPDGKVKFREL
jgi:hypothetical protein